MLGFGDPISLSAVADYTLALLLDVTLKGVLMLALVGVIARMLKNASASVQHLVWTLGIVSVLLVPVLSVLVPAWHVAALTNIPYLEEVIAPLYQDAPYGDQVASTSAASMSSTITPSATTYTDPAVAPTAMEPVPFQEALVGTFVRLYEAARAMPWSVWLLMAWLVGAGGVLFRFLVGAGGVGWLSFRARPVEDPVWTELAEEVRSTLSIRRRVRLLRSTQTATPMTWGLLRPVVLLPLGARDWSGTRRRCVLIHELGHVKRLDFLTQTLAQLACALYWFNPLVWIAARAMRKSRERACDDLVLAGGLKPSAYAAHLLDIARTTRSTLVMPLGAVEMARPSQLEGRVVAILDARQRRRLVRRPAHLAGALLMLAVAVPLAAIRPGEIATAGADAVPSFAFVETTRGPAYHWKGGIDKRHAIRLDVSEGDVQATPSPDGTVEVFVLGATTAPPFIQQRTEALTIRLDPSLDCGCEDEHVSQDVKVLLHVPEGVHFAARTKDGDIRVVDLKGSVDAISLDGDVYASASGVIRAETVDGDVTLRTAAYGEARTKDGDIDARLGQTSWEGILAFRSEDGHVTVSLPDEAHTEVDLFVEADGQLRSAIPLRQARNGGERFRGQLGRGGRLLRIHTVDGDVTIIGSASQALRAYDTFEVPTQPDERMLYRANAGGTSEGSFTWIASRDEAGRLDAVRTLADGAHEHAVEALSHLLAHDPSPTVRLASASALADLGCTSAVPALLAALEDACPDVRRTAAWALGTLKDDRAVAALTAALHDDDADVREKAAQALDTLGASVTAEGERSIEAGVKVDVSTVSRSASQTAAMPH